MRRSQTAGSSTPVTESTGVSTVMPMMAPYVIHLCSRSPRAEGAFCSDIERSPSDVAAARVALGSDPKAVGRLELVLEVADPNRPPAQWIRCSPGKSRTRMRYRQGRLHRDHLGKDHTARTYKDGYSPCPLSLSGPLTPIRTLRNRIAHHEPILHWNLDKHCANILRITGWLSLAAASWCGSHSRFREVWLTDRITLHE